MALSRVHQVNARTLPQLVVGLLITSVLAGVMPVQAAVQTNEGSRGGGGFLSVGVQQLDAGGLDQSLAGAGLPGTGSTAVTLGGGGHAVLGHRRIGGEGHGLRGSQRTAGDGAFETRVAGGFGLFTVGYDLAPRSRLEVVPRPGLVLGLRAGYLLPFAEGGWSTGTSRVAGGPSFKAKGFHFNLTIGW